MESPSQKCIVCGGDEYHLKYDLASGCIWRCSNCGMMCLWPQPTEEGLRVIYDDQYYKNEKFFADNDESLYGYVDYLSEKQFRRLDSNRILEPIAEHLPVAEGDKPSLLEVGCGLGLFMEEAYDEGFDVEGVEFNRYAYEHVRGKFNFPIHLGNLCDLQPRRESYDVCCLLDVIEHLLDPRAMVRRVSQLVRPGGMCVLQTMDCSSFVSRLLGARLEDFRRTREHLYFFDRKTIAKLLGEFGFEVVSISYIGHSFQLGFLLDRLDVVVPRLFKLIKRIIRPRWLLKATVFVNPRTKMLVIAKRRES